MKEWTQEEVRGLGHAVGLEIQNPELIEVTFLPFRAYDWEANR